MGLLPNTTAGPPQVQPPLSPVGFHSPDGEPHEESLPQSVDQRYCDRGGSEAGRVLLWCKCPYELSEAKKYDALQGAACRMFCDCLLNVL